jgi:hypothetical protein
MVPIVFFETTEVALECIGGLGYVRVRDVPEEIRKCFQQHAPGSHEVLKDPTTIGGLFDCTTETSFPGSHLRAKTKCLVSCLHL